MKKLSKTLLVGALFVFALPANAAKITIHILNHSDKKELSLSFSEAGEQKILIDKAGNGELDISKYPSGYATITYGAALRTLWLEPDKELSLSFDSSKFHRSVTFTGALAPMNSYLNDGRLTEIRVNDAEMSEASFLLKADSLLKANLTKLHQANLPENFNEQEQQRLTYFTYAAFTFYPDFHLRNSKDSTYKPSNSYWSKVQELSVMKPELLKIDEYKDFIALSIAQLAKKEFATAKDMNSTDKSLAYVKKQIGDARISEYLINRYIYSFVRSKGLDNADKYIATFYENVKDTAMVSRFKAVCAKWEKLQVGKPSPEFNATDVNGKVVALADLRGKYVYIDMWATWCGPCRKEIPFLQKLEEKYEGKDIHFVSISCDQSREAWEKEMAKGTMKGIQLHLKVGDSFMDDYMILGIPHFILLDKEGKIVNSNMTRPSNPDTVRTLDELQK